MSPWAVAQKEFTTWCFGLNVGTVGNTPTGRLSGIKLRFDDNGPVAPAGIGWMGYTVGTAGWEAWTAASISDANGNFLLLNDGWQIVDRLNRQMPHGDLHTMNPNDNWFYEAMHQAAAVVPGPNGLYYAFYWTKAQQDGQLAFALTYCVVDMRLNGGYGDVVQANLVLTRTFRPCMTVVRHRNNRDFWVVTRDLDSRGFHASLLTRQGVDPTPVVSLAGQALYPDVAQLRASPDGQRLACGALVPDATAPQWCLCLYDFDNASGQVSKEQVIRRIPVPPVSTSSTGRPLSAPLFSSACFSPDSHLLYASETNLPALQSSRRESDIWQYDLTQPTPLAIGQSRFWVSNVPQLPPPDNNFGPGFLQLTPNGSIWVDNVYARDLYFPGSFPPVVRPLASGIIRSPNVAGSGCGFLPEGYFYQAGQIPYGCPNVITNMLYAPAALNYEAGCPEDSVQLWASSAGDPGGLRWNFGEPTSGAANTAAGPQVAHHYAQGGTYPVRLTLADGRVLTQAVTVAAQAGDFTHANIFTPNGDGRNDQFTPLRTPLPGGHLRVFSRWGQPVFRTANADDLRWDGAGQPAGDYFYQLDYPDCQGATRHQRGTVTLVR